MNAGKAIYYLLANNAGVSAITTRIYPEVAPQDAAAPFIVYRITSVSPDDTHDGPATIDEVRLEVICVSDTYDQAADMGSVSRVALDRVYGTYNTVNVESIQFDDVAIYVRDQPRQYGQELTFTIRVKRDDVQIATGSPIEDITLGRLADVDTTGVTDGQVISYDDATSTWVASDAAATLVDLTDTTIDDPIDRQVLAYDEATGQWINDGAGSISIPVFNETLEDIERGRPLTATGSQGDRIAVSPYSNIYEELRFVGIAGESIPARSNGHATVYGEIRGLNTTNFEIGDFLYPVTGTNPTFYPYALSKWTDTNDSPLVCAIVTRKQQNTGRIFVRMWSPGYRNELRRMNDVQISTEFEGALLQYDSNLQKWAVPPQTSKLILEDATETVEIYYYSKTTDTQQYRDPQSDTPSAGNVIRRKIWYSVTAQDDIDSGTWILLQELDDDATYAQLVTAFESQLNTSPAGDTPVSIKTTWEDVPALTGLLDTYPGAAAAYSLRLLDSDYAGSAIRVRRASDNTEQDIGFDGNGDLDTSALATFCAGTDGFVKTWYDQSGNANDATQTTTSAQPKVYDSVTGVVTNDENGLPCIGHLTTATTQMSTTSTISGTSAATLLVAMHRISTGTETQPVPAAALSDGANTYSVQSDNLETSNAYLRHAFPNYAITTFGEQPTIDGIYLAQVDFASGTGVAKKNNDRSRSVSYTPANTSLSAFNINLFFSGSANRGDGQIQEVVYWPNDTHNAQEVIDAVNDYYSIYTL